MKPKRKSREHRPLAELLAADYSTITADEIAWLCARAQRADALERAAVRLRVSKDELAAAVAWGRLHTAAAALLSTFARPLADSSDPLPDPVLELERALSEIERLKGRPF